MSKYTFDGSDRILSKKLDKEQSSKPALAVKAASMGVAFVIGYDCFELGAGYELNDLGKNRRKSHERLNLFGMKVGASNPFLPRDFRHFLFSC